ncbi:hypothetical protein BCR41DRAFT_373260 [Lobosporangium transversale]|uniref:DDE Tnp4 domain-containing protein n=1 Tax=Lobosporangium transversale TaxID=64571 RepID=A0A1Y2GG53_9FUNG|nr:hypothetical protein BCR41DRAFT_373260 [Lobosporangium transversale]ORZ08561.1 hypothetical protein BCR41DRAFT_373260 [Lobosporangium transversale]|eukprot:XP_021878489.1 hypothetical protein BCR41DRAFT_373260 [Lobosporangium transversale]
MDALSRILCVFVGTLVKFYQRCTTAICPLVPMLVSWPNVEERSWIKDQFQVKRGFSSLLGHIDRITFPFLRASSYDKDDWITRYGDFVMGITVCPGSCHDSSAYKSTQLYTHKDRYFSEGECIIGDAAYGLALPL